MSNLLHAAALLTAPEVRPMARWLLAALLACAAATPAAAGDRWVRPIEPLTQGVVWAGEDTVALWVELRWLDEFGSSVTGIALRAPDGGETRWIRLPQRVVDLEASPDGAALMAATDDGSLLLLDPVEARVVDHLEVHDQGFAILAVEGGGDDLRVLLSTGYEGQLIDRHGAVLWRQQIAGKTPTITRVYHGGDTMHDNILEYSPSWIVAGAVRADGRYVALGGSDSVVRLFDREAGTTTELSFEWPYEERRLLGGNPDLNAPLALRFAGGELVGVFVHGDILRWNVATPAAPPIHLEGACGEAELQASRARFGEPQPWDETSEFGRECAHKDCAHARHGALTRDGTTALTLVNTGLRVRDARTGELRAQEVDSDLDRPVPSWGMGVSAGGQLALVGLYGGLATWSPQQGLWHHVVRPNDFHGVESLSPDGRQLTLNADLGADARWDLATGARTAVSSDFSWNSEVEAVRPLVRGKLPENLRNDQLAVSADGHVVAWIEEAGPQRSRITRLELAEGAGIGLAVVEAEGWPAAIGLSPDGSEVLYTLQQGTAVRWRPADQAQETVQRSELMLARDIRYLPGSDVIALVGYQQLVLVRDDAELSELATLFALRDGEWLLVDAGGRAQVSSEAALQWLLTVDIDDAGGVTVRDGRAGWPAVAHTGLWQALVSAPAAGTR